MADKEADQARDQEQTEQPRVAIQKVYLRDASVEVPDGPDVFTREFNPKLNVDLNTQAQTLSEESYQVMLTVTVTAQQEEATVYIVEVQQAAVFHLQNFEHEAQRAHTLGA